MGCLQNNFHGECNVWDESVEMPGCDDEGFCVCDDDEDPADTCEDYQSDWECSECGCDLNINECDCE